MGIVGNELIESFQVATEACDGFTDYCCINGIIRCAGYRLERQMDGNLAKVVVIRLVFPAECLDAAIFEARNAQARPIEARSGGELARH